MTEGTWTVRRHGGRRTDQWRLIYQGNEAEARTRYEREAERLRQGRVILLDPQEQVAESKWAPCLWRHW